MKRESEQLTVNGKPLSEQRLQKRTPNAIKEKGQYFLAFGVIATMLMVAGFPMFVIFFFGIFAYFLWKTFSSPSRGETREIFEFYLAANDVLRDDDRRWYGFEIQEITNRGERIIQLMSGAPPLVYFTLGALYQKIGDHKSAVNHLSYIVENENSDESAYAYPSPDLRNYVKILREIEREPHKAPLTAASIHALERARRQRGKSLLELSRAALDEQSRQKQELLLEQRKSSSDLPTARNGSGFYAVGDARRFREKLVEKFHRTTRTQTGHGKSQSEENRSESVRQSQADYRSFARHLR